MCK
jgi:hypothetical protein